MPDAARTPLARRVPGGLPLLVVAAGVGALIGVGLGGPIFAGAVLLVLMRFPEISLALFVGAGMYKADPRLAAVGLSDPVDLTVVLAAVCLAGIVLGMVQRRIRLFRPPLAMVVPFAVLLALAVLSLTWTWAPLYGHEKLRRFAGLTTVAFAVPWVALQDWRHVRRMLLTWVALAVAMMLDVVGGGFNPGMVGFYQAFGSSGYLGLANTCAQAVIIILFAYPTTRVRWWRVGVMAGALLVSLFGTLLAGARTSIPALLLTFATLVGYRTITMTRWAFLTGVFDPKSRRLFLVVLLLFGATGMLLLVAREYFVTLETRLILLLTAPEVYAAERHALVPSALDAMKSFPGGLGIGGFTVYHYGFDATRGGFPHNILLEVGAELGLVGLAAFVALCVAAGRTGLRSLRTATGEAFNLTITVIALFMFMLLYFQLHGDINDARALFLWMGSLFAIGRMGAGDRMAGGAGT